MEGRIRDSYILQSPFIKIKAKVTVPGVTNGIPNIKEEDRYVVAPSAKKIATYIRNQLFGSDLLTQTEGISLPKSVTLISVGTTNQLNPSATAIASRSVDFPVPFSPTKKVMFLLNLMLSLNCSAGIFRR